MRYGLIGSPLGHSYSPELHRRLHGQPYELLPLPPSDLPGFFARRDFEGVNVTIPYKKDVVPYCDALSETARRAGSVNTIVKRPDGTLFGDNTDLAGFQFMLREAGITLEGKHVLVLGNGGASLTVQLAAADACAQSVAVIKIGGYHGIYERCADAQVIVNATPVGMYPNPAACLVELSRFPRLEAAVDLIYNPLRTRFLQQAERLGLRTAGGLNMLVAQAAQAAKLFFGDTVKMADTARVLADMRASLCNWVLVGMPGCGKSTLGACLARRAGRAFIDLDAVIEARAGQSPGEMISRRGEAAFRLLESEVTAEFGAKTGLVIATGGGTVLRKENTAALRQNGKVLWIQRDISLLPTKNRPLSADLAALEKRRAPAYRDAADAVIQNDGDWPTLCEQAWEVFAQ